MLFYRAALPLSRQTLGFVSGIIRLLVLAYLRKGETFAELAPGVVLGASYQGLRDVGSPR